MTNDIEIGRYFDREENIIKEFIEKIKIVSIKDLHINQFDIFMKTTNTIVDKYRFVYIDKDKNQINGIIKIELFT